MAEFTFTGTLWRAQAEGAWRFVTVPVEVAEAIRLTSGPPSAFGSVRVEVRIGGTSWQTSVFPDAAHGTYVLPVKMAVRRAEDLADGDLVMVELRLPEP